MKLMVIIDNNITIVMIMRIKYRIKYRMEFKPHCQLRNNVIQNALKAYAVGTITSKYQVFAIISLCVDRVSK